MLVSCGTLCITQGDLIYVARQLHVSILLPHLTPRVKSPTLPPPHPIFRYIIGNVTNLCVNQVRTSPSDLSVYLLIPLTGPAGCDVDRRLYCAGNPIKISASSTSPAHPD